jgi:hypothetical protein
MERTSKYFVDRGSVNRFSNYTPAKFKLVRAIFQVERVREGALTSRRPDLPKGKA